jgi:hypothetical protein
LSTTFIARHARSTSYAAAALGALGMVGYVGGRVIAPIDSGLVPVVYVSAYVVLVGLALFGLVLVSLSFATRRPFILRGLAAVFLVFGILMVLFPYTRSVAYPEAVLATVAIFLLAAGWKDLRDPKLWGSKPTGSDA